MILHAHKSKSDDDKQEMRIVNSFSTLKLFHDNNDKIKELFMIEFMHTFHFHVATFQNPSNFHQQKHQDSEKGSRRKFFSF